LVFVALNTNTLLKIPTAEVAFMALPELAIKKTKATVKSQKLSDGGGMYLQVQPDGAKYWRLNYRFDGKQKTLALGVYPTVSLASARGQREDARNLLANGADPGAIKQASKQVKQKAHEATENTFKNLAAEFHKVKAPAWTEKHAQQWLANLDKYAFPSIGDKPLTDIVPMDIMQIMRDMEAKGIHETRDRLLQTIGSVFKYSMATGRAQTNPADVRIALEERPKVENFACISSAELPVFLRAVTTYQSQDKVSSIAISAFRLLMLTATRTSEVRFSKWADFDLDNGCWVIPAEQVGRKGKGDKRKDHAVPLCAQAVKILKELKSITGHGEYLFPNRNQHGKAISENTVLKIIETIGYKGRRQATALEA
jgi:integrase